ncbi:MAG: hypothetical protein C4330_02525 [Chitinophagaceae bacterium]
MTATSTATAYPGTIVVESAPTLVSPVNYRLATSSSDTSIARISSGSSVTQLFFVQFQNTSVDSIRITAGGTNVTPNRNSFSGFAPITGNSGVTYTTTNGTPYIDVTYTVTNSGSASNKAIVTTVKSAGSSTTAITSVSPSISYYIRY